MYSVSSYKLTKDEYNYLLPAIGRNKVSYHGNTDEHFLIVDLDGLEDVLERLKGLYDYYRDLPTMICYKCFKGKSLSTFREFFNSKD